MIHNLQNRASIDNTSPAMENFNTNILVAAYNNMSQCVNGFQKSVDTVMTGKLCDTTIKPYNLHQWYKCTIPVLPHHRYKTQNKRPRRFNRTGVRSDDFPNVDILSTALQKRIIHGKDKKLASFLIPSFESPQSHTILADGIDIIISHTRAENDN
ncbi:unnamed protein product [Mytilus edulis]|uniref:Uncharacterized protein n=1 Tax=Mytilus edulis TaxID=6550 RepID=A0A8S3TV43_MYTED|nr:unnamed protein product [Mytilus edulis]